MKQSRNQRVYQMRGCNRKTKKNKNKQRNSRRRMGRGRKLGGSAYPSKGPVATGFNFLNPQNTQMGGYPNGLVGNSWTPNSSGWPGVDNIGGNRNHLAMNTYSTDPQTAMISTGAQFPFSVGGRRRSSRPRRSRKMRGGNLGNFITQDFINVGRQVQHGIGSVFNSSMGYAQQVNPLPWKDQLPSRISPAEL